MDSMIAPINKRSIYDSQNNAPDTQVSIFKENPISEFP